MTPIKKDNSGLEAERDAIYRELIGTQEMLAQVLQVTGPVEVSKESVAKRIESNKQIRIDDDIQKDVFRFELVDVDEEGNLVE